MIYDFAVHQGILRRLNFTVEYAHYTGDTYLLGDAFIHLDTFGSLGNPAMFKFTDYYFRWSLIARLIARYVVRIKHKSTRVNITLETTLNTLTF